MSIPVLTWMLLPVCIIAILHGCGRGGPAADAAGHQVSITPVAAPAAAARPEPTVPADADAMAELRRLLPAKAGFRWNVFGIAEYEHRTLLTGIVMTAAGIEYRITGVAGDASGGESGLPADDFRIELRWIVTPQGLIQEKRAKMMMDSPCDRLELLRFPLKPGTVWAQRLSDDKGRQLTIRSEILSVERREGRRVFMVRYADEGKDYYEEREIEDGWGVVSLQRRLRNDEGEAFMVGWSVYREGSGYDR
jgi:hypothetical protein